MTDDITTLQRPRSDDTPAAEQPLTKRQKTSDSQPQDSTEVVKAPLLPPSHTLLGVTPQGEADENGFIQMLETDVGISEYVGRDIPPIGAVIKQRPACLSIIFAQNSYLEFQVHGFFSLRDRPKRQGAPFEVTRTTRTLFRSRHFKRCSASGERVSYFQTPSHLFFRPNPRLRGPWGRVCIH